jgi:hydrogenase expression/formation protein HypC
MCLSVPAKILSINGDLARVSLGGVECDACIQLIENAEAGNYVLLHAGFAIQKINEDEAMETIRLINEIEELGEEFSPKT